MYLPAASQVDSVLNILITMKQRAGVLATISIKAEFFLGNWFNKDNPLIWKARDRSDKQMFSKVLTIDLKRNVAA